MIYWVTVKKNLMEKGKKKLNAILEYHVVKPHALSHEIFAFIHILMRFHKSIPLLKNKEKREMHQKIEVKVLLLTSS